MKLAYEPTDGGRQSKRRGHMSSARSSLAVGILVGMCMMLGYWWIPCQAKEAGHESGIPAATVADYVHAVIEADRTFYTIHVVERLQAKGVVTATENWRVTNTLPLPVQFLREVADLATKTGANIDYRLVSLCPIAKKNVRGSDSEMHG